MTIATYQDQGDAGKLTKGVRIVPMITTSNLSAVTTAGWFNNNPIGPNAGLTLRPNDLVELTYNYGLSTQTTALFSVSISASNVVTLSLSESTVILPVTSGDFPIFSGTSGTIADSGLAPSSTSSQHFVVTTPGSLTSGNIPFLNDANGTLNTGRTPSATTSGYFVVMSPGSITTGHLFKAADANGTLADQGVQMKTVAQAAVAGGAAAQTVTDAFCTSASNVIACWNDTTNAVSIQKVAADNGSFVVTSSGDPGASHLNYVIYKA